MSDTFFKIRRTWSFLVRVLRRTPGCEMYEDVLTQGRGHYSAHETFCLAKFSLPLPTLPIWFTWIHITCLTPTGTLINRGCNVHDLIISRVSRKWLLTYDTWHLLLRSENVFELADKLTTCYRKKKKPTNWCQFLMRLFCYWQWISSQPCQSSLLIWQCYDEIHD